MATTLLEARVKFTADKVWQSQREGGKDYVSLKCETTNGASPNGKDPVVYANVGTPEHSLLSSFGKGDPVQLAWDGKKYSLIGTGGAMKQAVQSLPPNVLMSGEEAATTFTKAPEKPTMESLIEKGLNGAKLYYEIYSDLLMRGMASEQAQPAASTVFIQLARNL